MIIDIIVQDFVLDYGAFIDKTFVLSRAVHAAWAEAERVDDEDEERCGELFNECCSLGRPRRSKT